MTLEELLPAPSSATLLEAELTDQHAQTLDEIDEALMRRGTLNTEETNWRDISEKCQRILREIPHTGAILGLAVAHWQMGAGQDPVPLINLLIRFVRIYWAEAHPRGPKRARLRTAWLNESLKLTGDSVERYASDFPDQVQVLAEQFKILTTACEEAGVDWKEASTLWHSLCKQTRQPQSTPPPQSAQDPAGDTHEQPLDASGRAVLRRDLIALADRISRHEPGAGVAFAMRRYVTWMEFRDPSPTHDTGRIECLPLPPALLHDMHALSAAPSVAGLRKLEDRLHMSPFWFAGQKLAAEMATELGFNEAAQTIQREAARRLETAPSLGQLAYENGEPLIDEKTMAWLTASEPVTAAMLERSTSVETQGSEPEGGGLTEALSQLNACPSDQRGKAHLKFSLATTLLSHGHADTARVLLEELRSTLSEPVLNQWDRAFAQQVESLINQKA